MFKMVRVPTPPWARGLEVEFNNKDSEECFFAFSPRLEEVLKLLHEQVEIFVNDPEQTFLEEEEIFPALSKLSGEYYVSRIYFVSDESRDKRAYMGMSVMLHCIEKPRFDSNTDLDYLGLEAYLYIWKDTGDLEIDEGFNTSVI
jgi:hypothetical protein